MGSASIAVREPVELLTEIANTIAQDPAASLVWLCEGPDDRDVFRHHSPAAAVYAAGNKAAVIACADILQRLDPSQLAMRRWRRTAEISWFLVDRDYEPEPEHERVATTLTCSLEGDLLVAAGATAIKQLVLGIGDDEAKAVVEDALSVAAEVGRLRKYSHEQGLGLRLSGFPIDRVVDGKRAVDWSRVQEVVAERHGSDDDCAAAVIFCAQQESPAREAHMELANGHDLLRALQTFANRHPHVREGLSQYTVFRALVTAADPAVLEWLHLPHRARDRERSVSQQIAGVD